MTLQVALILIFGRMRVDSDNSLPIEIILIFHNVIILIKSVLYQNKNYYYNIFLEKVSLVCKIP